ncbi:MAG: SDR family NAD(P)-dependent oxidoreductase [Crocinitomicaceae bacterium]|nr:SDR family NAD(P)-dependent oxidoreductase [Crocinitomicaceae bacterium]
MSFKNKTVWVIGASSGIGEELAKQLANGGARVILSARNLVSLNKVKAQLTNSEKHIVFPLDLEKSAENIGKIRKKLESFGEIHFLFNNGGLSQRSDAFDTEIAVDKKIMEIDYFGNIALTKAILPMFRKQGYGHILVVSSIAGKFGFYLRSAYSASKHALHGFYESLRLEEEKNNIHVTIVCPGKINTPISTNALTGKGDAYGVMDHNQETGMPVEVCVKRILRAVEKNKFEVLIGGKETFAVRIKQLSFSLFYKIIRRQNST